MERKDLNAEERGGPRRENLIGGIVELKAIEEILPIHSQQLLSYLRLGGFKVGYLLNFSVPHMRDGIKRLVNGL
jgi:GxxExxY protein